MSRAMGEKQEKVSSEATSATKGHGEGKEGWRSGIGVWKNPSRKECVYGNSTTPKLQEIYENAAITFQLEEDVVSDCMSGC